MLNVYNDYKKYIWFLRIIDKMNSLCYIVLRETDYALLFRYFEF